IAYYSVHLTTATHPLAASNEITTVPVTVGGFGGDFTLQQPDGTPVKLSDFHGKVVLLYFGYTACPDVCPTSLAITAAALKALSPAEVAQVQPIFISVDPERDNGEQLMRYAKHFHPNFIGISGTAEQLQRVARQYGVFYNKVHSNSALGYLIDHSSQTYLVSKDGNSVTRLPHGTAPEAVATQIRQLL
ncbi:MAG: SCO family protein, partial [Thiothrix sp.]